MARGSAEDDPAAARPNDTAGHRARLRKRLLQGGDDALADHEVLEYLLATARPRIDTKPIAKSLLRRFGSLAGVLNADPLVLTDHPDMGETSAATLKIVVLAARRMARQQVREKPVLGSWQALLDYLQIDMAHLTVEVAERPKKAVAPAAGTKASTSKKKKAAAAGGQE